MGKEIDNLRKIRPAFPEGIEVTKTSLKIDVDLSFDEWEHMGKMLYQIGESVMWWIGDWLNYGHQRWGEKYAQAIEITKSKNRPNGYSYQTLRDAKWVSDRIKLSSRRDNLSWSFHQEVASLNPEEQDFLLEEAEKHDWGRSELRNKAHRLKHSNGNTNVETCRVDELSKLIDQGMKFKTIYVDPPWPYSNQATRGSTEKIYKTATTSMEDIRALPVNQLADKDAHLHLWTTNAFLFESKQLMEAWGFEYKSVFVWVKPQMGMGNYWRVSHEFMLFGLRGKSPFLDRSIMSWVESGRGEHSEKPDQIRQLIERVSPPPRLELFARSVSDGWVVWGDEIKRNLFYANATTV